MPEFDEWRGNPNNVSSLDYISGLLRACNDSGLTISKAHLSTIYEMVKREQAGPQQQGMANERSSST